MMPEEGQAERPVYKQSLKDRQFNTRVRTHGNPPNQRIPASMSNYQISFTSLATRNRSRVDARRRQAEAAEARSFSVENSKRAISQRQKLRPTGSSKDKLNKTNIEHAAAEDESLKLPNLKK